MNRRIYIAFALAVVVAMPALSQTARRATEMDSFASDFQTVPVMANTQGVGGAIFQTYVSLLNPTSSTFAVEATLFDAAGVKHNATITLAGGELKTYNNFLNDVFHYAGGGAVTFRSADTAGGTRNNRFIVNTEVRTEGASYSTPVPTVEFAGSNSKSFSPGITVDGTSRTNVGCFNQAGVTNVIKATVLDGSGTQTLGTATLNLPPNAWGQTAINAIVSNGYVRFEPAEAAVCYAVVVNNSTNDGRFITAAEYTP